MKHLLEMLKEAGVNQTTDWGIFQRHPKNLFYLTTPMNSTITEVYVKFNGSIQKYDFDIQGKLVGVITQANDA